MKEKHINNDSSMKKPLIYEDLSEEEFDNEIMKALDDFDNGRTYTSEEVKKELDKIL